MVAFELGNALARVLKFKKIVKMKHFKTLCIQIPSNISTKQICKSFFFFLFCVRFVKHSLLNHVQRLDISRRLLPGCGSDLY